MKYIKAILFSFILAAPMAHSQEEVVKDFSKYLPEAGDIAIGADALPYLEYIGNMFNNTQNNTLNLGENNTLYLKYFLQDDRAIRVNLNINNSTDNNKMYVADDFEILDALTPNALAEDLQTIKQRDYSINVGYQIYKTRKRLAGYYGAQIGYGSSKLNYEYSYANPITEVNQTPSTYYYSDGTRVLNSTNGKSQTISVGGFIGVEYFFAPKMSIGGEYSLGYAYNWESQANGTSEMWNGSGVSEVDSPYVPSQSNSSLSTSRPATYGGLYLMFYF